MSLADEVRQSVLAKEIVERATAFGYYYYELKKMVTDERLMEYGSVTFFNRRPLNGQLFHNERCGSRWDARSMRRSNGNHEISLTLMR